jgi:hypothetical protein
MKKVITELTYIDIDELLYDVINVKGKLFKKFFGCSNNSFYNTYIFRGQPSINYKLIPCALREDKMGDVCELSGYISPVHGIQTELQQIECEEGILKKFYHRCDENGLKIPLVPRWRYHNLQSETVPIEDNNWIPNDLFEVAGLAQHYGLPTRLLDWSFNFFVALYFALNGAKIEDEYCSVWAYNYDNFREYYNNQSYKLVVVIPEYSQNPNLKAQRGVFTLWQKYHHYFMSEHCEELKNKPVDRRSLDELFESKIRKDDTFDYSTMFYNINIPIKYSQDIYKVLSSMGYNAASLFPGYGGVTRLMKEDASYIHSYITE